jgi:superfamily I DNA and/or RNA helicase
MIASASTSKPSLGVVTPHNAQRGALETVLPDTVTPNTVEKYQGGECDIVAVCGTVSDPAFARQEEQFILNPNRLLVAISRSRLLTIVVCSDALFEVAPRTRDNLDNGPVWARLFTETIGEMPDPTWAGSLSEFTGEESDEHSTVPVTVYANS